MRRRRHLLLMCLFGGESRPGLGRPSPSGRLSHRPVGKRLRLSSRRSIPPSRRRMPGSAAGAGGSSPGGRAGDQCPGIGLRSPLHGECGRMGMAERRAAPLLLSRDLRLQRGRTNLRLGILPCSPERAAVGFGRARLRSLRYSHVKGLTDARPMLCSERANFVSRRPKRFVRTGG